jgi:two-component system sensor histidine kinase AtoS
MYLVETFHNKNSYLVREEDCREYFESASNGIIHLDSNLRIKNMNHEAARICAVDRTMVMGKRADIVFHGLGEKFVKVFDASDLEEIKTANIKLKIREQHIYVHIDSLRLFDSSGNINGSIIILQDVSAVRAAIKQIQTTQMLMSLGELAAGVAHHVRTPLTTISGYLQVMLGRLEDDKYTVRKDVLENLLTEVSYINNTVKELILFAKPPVEKEAGVDINALLEEALRLTFKELGGEDIGISKQLTKTLPSIYADSNLLKQAVVNIMQNAMEAMPSQGILGVRTWFNTELNMLVIAIADNGLGINPEILSKIFEPFYTTKLDRMGLGLPIANRIVVEHGGFINISTRSNGGTKVHMYLPVFADSVKRVTKVHQQQILNLQ